MVYKSVTNSVYYRDYINIAVIILIFLLLIWFIYGSYKTPSNRETSTNDITFKWFSKFKNQFNKSNNINTPKNVISKNNSKTTENKKVNNGKVVDNSKTTNNEKVNDGKLVDNNKTTDNEDTDEGDEGDEDEGDEDEGDDGDDEDIDENFETNTENIGIISMMKDPKNIETWLKHHRDLGIKRFYIRLEETPTIEEYVKSQEDVYLQIGKSTGKNEYNEKQTRQRVFIDEMLEKARDDNIKWVIHIDSDELVVGDLNEIRELPENVRIFWMQNEEAKYAKGRQIDDVFKFITLFIY
jgi:hypothetical protein